MKVDGYLAGSMEVRWGFVQGAYETVITMAEAGLIGVQDLALEFQDLSRCTERMTVPDLELVFTLWLDEHPARWTESLAGLFLESVLAHCG